MKLLKIIILTVFLFPILFVGAILFIITIDMKKISDFIDTVFGSVTNYYIKQLEGYILTRK